jgi:regulator of nucleoside diphosphate kinase
VNGLSKWTEFLLGLVIGSSPLVATLLVKLVTKARALESKHSNRKGNQNMKTRDIVVTESDRARLHELIALAGNNPRHGLGDVHALRSELDRARIVADRDIPDDVIKLNSQAVLVDLDTGERMEFTLVLPVDANIDEGRISVFAPMGMAMLGYRIGDKFEWTVPYGLRRMEVAAVSHDVEVMLSAA